MIGRASALASSGGTGSLEVDVGEDRAHGVGRLGHQRRVGGDRHRQHDRALRAQLLRDLGGRLDRGSLAGDDDLARRVAVRDAEDAVRGGARRRAPGAARRRGR